ncbi:GcrA family cell cycle regulator [Sphingomonas sp. BK235]|uniref:GcrA family cell cycle regulator n=1 Tax=Sphingomonas sp. BK235 TaxID=2512131 RepID=UPI00104E775F|nr:GcrA family cell cycle regulator [Sphingomonas sp. BK235]TCP30728.1 GcrA cell cycle regulator [Sphingomonas sp. BK235]
MRRAGHDWTEQQVDQLCRLKAAGKTNGQVAEAMGLSRNAVAGQINRLRAKGDKRISPAAPTAAAEHFARKASRSIDDRLAELMELRSPTLQHAAFQLGVSLRVVEDAWDRILATKGDQAR